MNKYRIGRSYGYAGDDETIEVEAESLSDAEDAAWEWAVERVNSWAEKIGEDDE